MLEPQHRTNDENLRQKSMHGDRKMVGPLLKAGKKNTRANRSHLDVSGRADSDASVGRGVQLARSSQTHDATFVRKKKKKKNNDDDEEDARIKARFNERGQYVNAVSTRGPKPLKRTERML